jgi:hypothetical protein
VAAVASHPVAADADATADAAADAAAVFTTPPTRKRPLENGRSDSIKQPRIELQSRQMVNVVHPAHVPLYPAGYFNMPPQLPPSMQMSPLSQLTPSIHMSQLSHLSSQTPSSVFYSSSPYCSPTVFPHGPYFHAPLPNTIQISQSDPLPNTIQIQRTVRPKAQMQVCCEPFLLWCQREKRTGRPPHCKGCPNKTIKLTAQV